MNIFIMYNIQKIYEERTDMLGLQLLAVFCSYSFRQGQEHKTSLQLMQLQFYGHVYRHLFLLDGNCCSCNFTAMHYWKLGFFCVCENTQENTNPVRKIFF